MRNLSNDYNGPNWVGFIANEVANDTTAHDYWGDTAIIVTWDDWGGWYDHVLPQFRTGTNPYANPDPFEYGLRTPLLVVSQWAKQGIHQGYRSQASILKFIEKAFVGLGGQQGLGTLGSGTPDTDPFNDDLLTASQDPLFDLSPSVGLPRPSNITSGPFPGSACQATTGDIPDGDAY